MISKYQLEKIKRIQILNNYQIIHQIMTRNPLMMRNKNKKMILNNPMKIQIIQFLLLIWMIVNQSMIN